MGDVRKVRRWTRGLPLVLGAITPVAQAIGTGTLSIGLEPTASMTTPIDLVHAGDGTSRMFIAGQNSGDIRLFKNNGLVTTPFLDINGSVSMGGAGITLTTGGERGLLGIAFHPNYSAAVGTPGRGRFFTYTSEPKGPAVDFTHPELGSLGDHDTVIREWTVGANPDLIDPASSRELMRIRQPQSNHNGGAIKFGQDGYLYIALGDGGGADDEVFTNSATDGHTNTMGNGQDTSNVYGDILRINPLRPTDTPGSSDPISANTKYRVAQFNPFIGATPGVDEIYAYGLRNPFRMSFDRQTGDLYAGDVGQGQREEVDKIEIGKNYGWAYREGTLSHQTFAGSPTLTGPLYEYGNPTDGQAIIGGNVYRGKNIPELFGKYVFGDLGRGSPTIGRLFYMDLNGTNVFEFTYLTNTTQGVNPPAARLFAFGEDRDGELYAMFENGTVVRILGRQWMQNGSGSWNTTTNWLGAVPNAVGASANFFGRLTTAGSAPATITLDGNKSVAIIRFNNATTNGANQNSYVISPGSGGTLTMDNGLGTASILVFDGSHAISAPVFSVSHLEMDIVAGRTLSMGSSLTMNNTKTLTKKGAGTVVATSGITLNSGASVVAQAGTLRAQAISGGSLTVQAGANVVITANGGNSGISRLTTLNIDAAGKLDLNDNDLVVSSGNVVTIRNWVIQGVGGTAGITSSTSNGSQILALFDNALVGAGSWGGQPIAANAIVGKYTYFGDANLDGQVTGDDYTVIDANLGTDPTVGLEWLSGDMNLDGVVSGDDYTVVDANLGLGLGNPLTPSDLNVVPEPVMAGAVLLLGVLGRRSRKP